MPSNGGHTTFILIFKSMLCVVVLAFGCIRVVAPNCKKMLETKGRGPNHTLCSVGSQYLGKEVFLQFVGF